MTAVRRSQVSARDIRNIRRTIEIKSEARPTSRMAFSGKGELSKGLLVTAAQFFIYLQLASAVPLRSPNTHSPLDHLKQPAAMPFRLEKCSEDDMAKFFEIVSLAFEHEHEYIEAVYPQHDKREGRAAGAERLLVTMKADVHATFSKVMNDQGEMIAGAKWNIYDHVLPPEFEAEGNYWENEEEKEYAQHMFRTYLVPRRRAIKESGVHLVGEHFEGICLHLSAKFNRFLALDMTVVHPDFKKQGAGRMLVSGALTLRMKWGSM